MSIFWLLWMFKGNVLINNLSIINFDFFFRLYHYSNTNLPQPPFAINQPAAEDMVDQPWLITRICRMIDEFSDVNEGEKEFIKMWNIHVQHFTWVKFEICNWENVWMWKILSLRLRNIVVILCVCWPQNKISYSICFFLA